MKRYYIFFSILTAICLLAVITNTAIRRGPVHDSKAAADIRLLQSAIDNHYVSNRSQLPNTLTEVRIDGDVTKRLPAYTYQKTSATTYRLCTDFQTQQTAPYAKSAPQGPDYIPEPEYHGKGHQCFNYTVLPVYPMRDPAVR